MAAITTAIMGGVGIAKGAYDTVQASKEKKKETSRI